MNIPKISVIITFFNEKDYQVRRSIISVLNQTFLDYELLCILDNPHNDSIFSILKGYEIIDNRIIAIKLDKNLGISGARNKGAEISKAEYVTFLDGDDEYLPEKLEKQYQFMLNNQLDISGTYTIWKDEETQKTFFYKPNNLENTIKYQTPIPQTSMMVRKDSFFKYGSFDPKLKISEDYDFVIRWFLQGAKMENLSEHLVIYNRHSNSVKNATRKQVLAGIKVKIKYRKELGLSLKHYLRIIFADLLIVVMLPQKLVKRLIFLKNRLGNKITNYYKEY